MPARPQPVSPAAPSATWSEAWSVDPAIRIQTAEEQIYCARNRTTGNLAFWHRVTAEAIRQRSDWQRRLPEIGVVQDAEFAPLLGWGWVEGHWCYLTALDSAERLEEWQPRRLSSSATSIRMQLMLQTIQMAAQILANFAWPRQMQSQLLTVRPTGNEDEPYRLIGHCWLPSLTFSATWENSVMQETARALDLITTGMPWPLELTRAFQEEGQPVRQRLRNCEAILLAQWERSSQPARALTLQPSAPKAPRRHLPRVAMLSLFALGAYFAHSQWPQAKPSTASHPTNTSDPAPPPAPEPLPIIAMPPLAVNPEDVALIRQQLATATLTGVPTGILPAAKRLLQLVPEDPDTRELVTTLLHQETRKLIDFSNRAPLAASEDWAAWAALGFPDARMLHALQIWPTRTSEAMEELQRLSENGSTTATVLLGQLAAHNRAEPVDYVKALTYFTQAAQLGDPAGAYLVGECHVLGKGVPRDPEKGIPYLNQAAAAGDHRAMDLLGRCYHKGWGVKTDPVQAVAFFLKAIGLGNLHALSNLAVLYLNGEGVALEKERGIMLLQKGARQHDATCLYLLGQCAETGNGVEKDPAAARQCYEAAAELGHAPAKQWLELHPPPTK